MECHCRQRSDIKFISTTLVGHQRKQSSLFLAGCFTSSYGLSHISAWYKPGKTFNIYISSDLTAPFFHRQKSDGGFGLFTTGKKSRNFYGSCKRKGICNIAWNLLRVVNSVFHLMRRKRAVFIGSIWTNTGTKCSCEHYRLLYNHSL